MVDSSFNPAMLTLAREARGLSQTALAEKSGINQGVISRMESGVAGVSTYAAEALAAALDFPPSIFAVADRPVPLPIFFHRKRAKLGTSAARQIHARINIMRVRLATLLRATEPTVPRLVLGDVDSRHDSPARIANDLRIHWRLAPGPIPNLTMLLEQAGVMVVPVDFGTPLMDGLSMWEPSDVLPPIIFVNVHLPGDRLRWTLAHELAHIVLHHHLALVPMGDVEAEADAFATELLMPAADIRGHFMAVDLKRLAHLKLHWRVSMRALVMRAQKLRKISDSAAKTLFIRLNQFGSKTEPVDIPVEAPTQLRSLVERHLTQLGYTSVDLSAMLHQTPDEFRSEFGIAAPHLRLS